MDETTTANEGWGTVEKELKELSDHLVNVRLDIRELTTEVRSLKALQQAVTDHETRLVKVEDKAVAAHRRLNKVDKIFWWFGTSVGVSIILAIMSLILKKG